MVAFAEKAALKAYRDALQAYDERLDNDVAAGDHYPWLFNYAVNDFGGGYPELNDFPSDPVFATERANFLDRRGRVPSPFTNYFTETNGQSIESRIGISMSLVYPNTPAVFNPPLPPALDDTALPDVIDTPNDTFDGTGQVLNGTSTDPMTFVQFQDIDPDVFSANDGRLLATVVTNETFTFGPIYFWDEKPIGDGWTLCLDGANDPLDCTRDAGGANVPGLAPNQMPSQVLEVRIDVELQPAPVTANTISFTNIDPDIVSDTGAGFAGFSDGDLIRVQGSSGNDGIYRVANATPGILTLDAVEQLANELAGNAVTVSRVIEFGIDYAVLPVTTVVNAADNTRHANIRGTINGVNIDAGSLPATASYVYDSYYNAGFDNQASGTMSLAELLADWAFDDGWYESIQMAYANDYRPDIAAGPCTAGTDCLDVINRGGTNDDKISILVLGGEHDWNDDFAAGLADDLGDIFDLENDDPDDRFDASRVGGNDTIMVVEEL